MNNPAPTDYPVLPAIQNRWSPRAYNEQSLTTAQLGSLLEAFRWAPSSFNEQPWRVFVGCTQTNPKTLTKLRELLVPGNAWALKAPVLLLTCAEQTFKLNGKPNGHAAHDTGMALANLCIQAASMGLVTHSMGGFDAEAAKTVLVLSPSVKPLTMVAVGYQGELGTLSEHWQREAEVAPRERNPLQSWLFSDHYGQAFSGVSSTI